MKNKIQTKKGIQLWDKAKKIIPGGTQLLSKHSERFLPDQWPAYYKKAKGVEVWDLDGNHYIDMSIMGVGACILGYADPDVNRAVKRAIDEGSLCTLNSPEEVELTKLLLKLHPWAGMVRLARTGGEAMAIAVRIARAYTKKDKVAFCGYHGWCDWYLSANLADKTNLDGQLLPGLKPLGVPRVLKGTALPFNYNKINELKKIVKNHNIGVIVVETVREHEPRNDFLSQVRNIADRKKAILIFDEITSGWRMSLGGAYKAYNGHPDIVVYGKAIGNGFPLTAIVGKKEIMDVAQDSFISSTFWTERVGPTAALATIKKLKEKRVSQHLMRIGKLITEGWQRLANKHGFKIKTMGILPLTTFAFDYGDLNQALHTFFTQEMLARGFLASKSVYVSYAHTPAHVSLYLKKVDEVFFLIKQALGRGDIKERLKGPPAYQEFKRLT